MARRLASTHLLLRALAIALLALCSARPARAHGPAPAALAVLDWEGREPRTVRLNVGLARRQADGRYRFMCPALWDDTRAAPAAALPDGSLVVAASSGLYISGADGALRPHADANARGACIDLVRGGDALYALRVVAGQSQVLAIDAESVRTIWSAAETFYSIAADAERLLLLRATELSVDWQWLEPSGAAAEAGQAALPVPIEYAFARLSRGAAYALVLEQGRPELGRLGGDGWLSIAKANSSIAGPLLVGDAELLAVDGQLNRLADEQLSPLEAGPYVSCLERGEQFAYVCTREGLSALDAEAVGAPLFQLAQLAPPDLHAIEDAQQRDDCDFQWEDLRFDLIALGIELTPDPEPAADAGVPVAREDAAVDPPVDASPPDVVSEAPRASKGCSTLGAPAASPLFPPALLLALALAVTQRTRRRRR